MKGRNDGTNTKQNLRLRLTHKANEKDDHKRNESSYLGLATHVPFVQPLSSACVVLSTDPKRDEGGAWSASRWGEPVQFAGSPSCACWISQLLKEKGAARAATTSMTAMENEDDIESQRPGHKS